MRSNQYSNDFSKESIIDFSLKLHDENSPCVPFFSSHLNILFLQMAARFNNNI